MADPNLPVKGLSRRIAAWIDSHPRSGWYLTVWLLLVTSNALWEWLDRIISMLS